MTTMKKFLMGAAAGLAVMAGTGAMAQTDEITVGYFLEWPMPSSSPR